MDVDKTSVNRVGLFQTTEENANPTRNANLTHIDSVYDVHIVLTMIFDLLSLRSMTSSKRDHVISAKPVIGGTGSLPCVLI